MWESEKFSSTLMAEGEIRLQTEGRTMLTGQNIQPEEEIRERGVSSDDSLIKLNTISNLIKEGYLT
jgi:hypothetical protein